MITASVSRSIAEARVLVIDDTPDNQYLVGRFLNGMGIRLVEYAADGIEGLEKVASFCPDLVVLDIMMPRMDGFETLGRLRQPPSSAKLPVIVQTANDSHDNRERMFDSGATDFISKPLNRKEFQARIRVHLENLFLVRNLERQLGRIADELVVAEELQRSTLPQPALLEAVSRRYGLVIDSLFETSSELGGDCWGMLPVNEAAVAVYLCDFAGHGVSAAMNTFRLQALMERLSLPVPDDPGAYVEAINHGLSKLLTRRHFATFLLGVINVENDTFTYATGAAPSPLLGHNGGGVQQVLSGQGLPLGLVDGMEYPNTTVPFGPGSFLFLYSDALYECRDRDGRALGNADMIDLVSRCSCEARRLPPLEQLRQATSERFRRPLDDDLTAIWISRAGQ